MKIAPVAKTIDYVKQNQKISKAYKKRTNLYFSYLYQKYLAMNDIQNCMFYRYYRNLLSIIRKNT